ncbi:UNC93-like protein [Argiope bruennichi]|uniref:UNC93-like protein n=1 Tax=Argiope bruennichi TaxID=94029 RepID=UPI0024947314|nr:UNC93-like protein [Argiope bruennichi]
MGMMLPYIASNFYPTWITMIPAAILRGIGSCLLWAAMCTYFNESSVRFCKIAENGGNSKCASQVEPVNENSQMKSSFKLDGKNVEKLSASDLLNKASNSPVASRNCTRHLVDTTPVRLTACKSKKDSLPEIRTLSKVKDIEITEDTKDRKLKNFKDTVILKTISNVLDEKKEEISFDSPLENAKANVETSYQSYLDSTKSLFFGIQGLAYYSANVWGSLFGYYVLKTDDKDYIKSSNYSCGADFCSATKDGFSNGIEEVPNETRYLLTGVSMTCVFIAPLIIWLFLDRIDTVKNNVKLSWDHVFATIKYIKKKDQILLIPFTIGACLCRGFHITDFTKSYIACAWSISHIGLFTLIYGISSALSAIFSGAIIKCVGRRSVLIPIHIIVIANFVFLFFWSPSAQQPYIFYVQVTINGLITSALVTQSKAFYGILFEGDEETAFSSCNLYTSIGWAVPFIYNDLFCTSVKIIIVLAFSCAGFLGYLLAEKSYNSRKKEISESI